MAQFYSGVDTGAPEIRSLKYYVVTWPGNSSADNVHCVFVEPTAAPAVMLQVAAGRERPVSVYDYGLDNKTIADGLAVSSASQLVVQHVGAMIKGFATVNDGSVAQIS